MKISGIKLDYKVLSLILFISAPVSGQLPSSNDTILIKEVIIGRSGFFSGLPGFKKISVDSTLLSYYTLLPVTETLDNNSQLFFKSYGAGAMASTSFRGAGASRTQLSWNGINLNDPMLGQTDFSLFPSGMADGIQVSYGAASMETGFGGIGGLINLENKPVWAKQTTTDIKTGYGSFDSWSGLLKFQTGTNNFQSVTKAFFTSSENDFPFLNTDALPEPELQRRKNGSGSQKGFMQELYYKKAGIITSARIWYQSASRHLPGSTLYEVPDSAEYQYDESLRTQISSDYTKGKNDFFINGAWLYSKLNYSFPKYYIDSRNRSNSFVLKAGMTKRLSDFTCLKLIADDEINSVVTVNYLEKVSRNTASLTLSAEHKAKSRFGTLILIREILNDGKLLVPDISAGFQYRLISGSDHFLKLNVARNSSIPTMNDLNWNPGGNQNLRNEYSYSYELGYCMVQKISPVLTINSELTYFNNHIRDMILWHPGDSYYWIVDNIGSVNTKGFESSVSLKYNVNSFHISLNSGYSFTKASEINSEIAIDNGKQLIYVPQNRASSIIQLLYKDIYLSWVVNFTGRTWTTSDNSAFLRGYTLNGVVAGYKFRPGNNLIDLNFRIDNIFDISHQAINHYPLAGRSFNLSILFSLKNNQSEN
jgi:iron complex outermembrane receptor protein